MTDLSDMSEREYFALFAKRSGMYILRSSFPAVTAFMQGYDFAARRNGSRGLDGWREWLMTNHHVSSNFSWQAQILEIALPGWEGGWDLTAEQDAHAVVVLLELFDTFLTEREAAEPRR